MKNRVAGLSLGGGRKENFYLCLIEYFPSSDRWFLKSIHQVKDEHGDDGDQAIKDWINQFELEQVIVDFPLSQPACSQCQLECPGLNSCPVEEVVSVREKIKKILDQDQALSELDPKKYERDRNDDDLIDSEKFLKSKSNESNESHILSRSYKRKLKKGYLPYWHRPIDLYIWTQYYDHLLKLFSISYDSYGNISQMLLFRFNYLKNHFPRSLKLYESNYYLCLIELLRAKHIAKRSVMNLSDIDLAVNARLEILRDVERFLKIFIYDHDLEIIIKDQRAFSSFILAVVGQAMYNQKIKKIPSWPSIERANFVLPTF
jgi:hypothetical protein